MKRFRLTGRAATVDPWLVAFFLVAVIVRFWGLRFGLPHILTRPDEETIQAIALRFFSRHLHPQFFRYPSLLPFCTAVLFGVYFNIGRVTGWFPSELRFIRWSTQWPPPLFVVQRSLVAATGALAVPLVYSIAGRVGDRRTARIAAFFMALMYLHVRDSHFGVTDVPMTLLVLASVALALRYVNEGKDRDIIKAGVFAGLAASTKYTGALALAAVVVAAFVRPSRSTPGGRPARRAATLAAAAIAVAVVAFAAGTPFAVLDPLAFWRDFSSESAHLAQGHIAGMPSGWYYHLLVSLRYGATLPLLLAGVGGGILLIASNRRAALVVLAFPFVYYAAMGYGRTAFVRYMIPVLPFVCIGAAFMVTSAVDAAARLGASPRLRAVAAAALAVLLVVPSALAVVRVDRLLSTSDTRLLAAEYIATRWPGGATVGQPANLYARVQFWPRPWGQRYLEVTYDGSMGTFKDPRGEAANAPDVVVVASSPLAAYDPAVPQLPDAIARGYTLVQKIEGTRPTGENVYDQEDALYIPLGEFHGVARPGPNLNIYARVPDTVVR